MKAYRPLGWLVATMVTSYSTAALGQAAPSQPPQVVATGEGEAKLAPDRATIYLGIQSRATSAAAASADNARRQRAVLDTLRAIGLGSTDLSTLNYSVAPEMQYDRPGGAPRVTGYVVTNTVRADIRRLDDIGPAIDASLAKGANQVSGLEFYSSNPDDARHAALAAAVTKARSDAETMAKAGGGSLGALLELTSSTQPVRPYATPMRGVVGAMAAPQTPIEPGQQTIRSVVTGRWAFVPGR